MFAASDDGLVRIEVGEGDKLICVFGRTVISGSEGAVDRYLFLSIYRYQ